MSDSQSPDAGPGAGGELDGAEDSETPEGAGGREPLTRVQDGYDRALRFVFGDGVGLTLFLGAIVFYFLYWRVGFFIQDNVTIANTLANVAEGRLSVAESPYSLTFGAQPGLVEVDGQAYGRNYGHVFLALPFLLVFEAISALTEFRLFLAGVWSLFIVVFARRLADHTGIPSLRPAGVLLALVVFLGSVATATALSEPYLEIVALQAATMTVTALSAVAMYRLGGLLHSKRVGIALGAGFVLATPVAFWATIPKRHALTAGVVVATLYWFAASREPGANTTRLRAAAYGAIGLLTVLHPFEALFLFLVFAPLDFLTAPSVDARSTAVIGVVFMLAVLPMLIVNTLISGNPVRAPRMLSGVPDDFTGTEVPGGPGEDPADPGDGDPADDGTPDAPDGDSSLIPTPILRAFGTISTILAWIVDPVRDGVAASQEPGRLYHTFVRSGWIPGVRYEPNDFETVELTVLESFPPLAALLYLPVAAARRVRNFGDRTGLATIWPRTVAGKTDTLAAGYFVVFTLVYLHRLPLFSQITVRYILPVFPLLLYGVVRIGAVNRAIDTKPGVLAGSYVLAVTVGGVLLLGVLSVADPAVGEAMQLHALAGIAAAAVGALAVLTEPIHEDDRVIAAGIAVPAAATTLLVLAASLLYFQYGPFILDIVEWTVGHAPSA